MKVAVLKLFYVYCDTKQINKCIVIVGNHTFQGKEKKYEERRELRNNPEKFVLELEISM